ncbi:Cell division control/GTP binding protein [Mycena venus]|uniref:Cell division control/GTP binding protein n=1 Tax=Mycena venus TaxID=2733690 RepID=A0A8H6XTN8_9AGAR|nr:Cell division control/GTP binding protein [Mycena venus]
MSLCLARNALRSACFRTAPRRPIILASRGLETKEPSSLRDSISPGIGTKNEDIEYYEDILEAEFEDDDTAAAGHLMLRQQRQVLYYLRLIEHEMPKLVAYRKPFEPPSSRKIPLVVRSVDYAGEEHPVTAKRVIVAAVDDLPLKNKAAIHRIKVLAGPRWTPNPPTDGGISGLDEWKNGYIKIACEDFPQPAMNLKWASDTMDRLVAHANNPKHDLKDVPVDLRHVYAKARKAKKGEHTRSRVFARPSIIDFPMEWIPERRRKYALARERDGSQLAVFPEAFIGGYPKFSTFGTVVGERSPEGREEYLQYHKAAVEVPSPATARIEAIAKDTGVFLVVGVIERDGGTLYCTALFVDPLDGLLGKHRKILPTASERLIWGQGGGSTLPVFERTFAQAGAPENATFTAKISAAICWENYMPLLRNHYYSLGTQLYCAPTVDARPQWQNSMIHIALEGRVFVLAACQYAKESDYPATHAVSNAENRDPDNIMIAGGSVIISPLGKVLAGPLRDKEDVLTAELDLDDIIRGKMDLDVVGNYARPDIFKFERCLTRTPPATGTSPPNGMANASNPSLPNSGLPSVIRKKLMGYVGFANLPNQVHRKSVRKGFQFTAMVVGEEHLPPSAERPKTVAIESIGADIEENGVRLHLTVVDTPGFGDFVNNDDSWKPIVENIESRFDSYLEQENRVNRMKVVDNRVHACLYFIQPTGHSLHTKVNLIPVIAKADTMTDEEIADFKERILSDIAHHNIHIFQAPTYDNEDEETIAEHEEIASKIPFAVVGSDKFVVTPNGREVRGRAYPWGVVEVDNEEHCDFVKLRQMLVRTYMEELREYTNDVLYENWRTEKLISMGVAQDSTVFKEINPAARMQEERVLHEAKLAKMEAEMKMVFQQKVQEKEAKLKQSEEELYARHKEMKDALEKQRADLEEKKKKIESGRPITPEKNSTGRRKGFLRT